MEQDMIFPSTKSCTYDVFLSFRGEDTRYGFTGSLYHALDQKGINTFMDDEVIKRGEQISPTIFKAIEESRMAIIVFSKTYASSKWCLHDLVKIIGCFKAKELVVFPVFYNVDPSEVRNQTGGYGQEFAKHEEKMKYNKKDVQGWRLALRYAANLAGWCFRDGYEYEYAFIERIADTVCNTSKQKLDYAVGLEPRVSKILYRLQMSDPNVIKIGICGVGGIGKTTLARAVYDSIGQEFEGLCFLNDVRENSTKYGLVYLQQWPGAPISISQVKIFALDRAHHDHLTKQEVQSNLLNLEQNLTMESKTKSLESSLTVPSVQELSLQSPQKVPQRYIRDDGDDDFSTFPSSDPSLTIPLIDKAKLVNADTQQDELHKLHLACKNWGVFQIVNHGVSSLKNMGNQVKRFFDLPLHEKKRWAQKPGSLEGYGQAFVTSEEQKLDWNDMIFLKSLPIQNRKLDLWPQNPPEFRETLEKYSEEMREEAISIVSFITLALGLEDTKISESFNEGLYDIRMNCYPPCPEPERVLGIIPHADNSGITLLVDFGDFPGLQFLKDGKWVGVQPIEGAIVANIGHIIEVMTNGIYKAPEHRAVVNKMKERLTIVTFCYPNPSTDIAPAKKLIGEGNQQVYKNMTHEEYFNRFFNRKLDESFIDSLRL